MNLYKKMNNTNCDFNKPTKIKDESGNNGILFERVIYRKAWFHKGFQRWDVNKYGEEGTNLPLYAYDDSTIRFFVFSFIKSNIKLRLERKVIDSFYFDNPQCKIYSFGQNVLLLPLSICKKYE